MVTPRARLFTEFVRALAAGVPMDGGRLHELRSALQAALRSEMRRRGLWDSPPGYLGIYGWRTWSESSASGGSPLEELLDECYTYIFVDRLRSLTAQLAVKANVDGLVFLDIKHFLHERQKEHDPLGFRVFEMVWAAVQHCLAEGLLLLIEGDQRVRNDTVLGFDAGAPPPQQPVGLRAWAARIDDELLPDLITARGERRDEVILELARNLSVLHREGVTVFRFKDLIDPFKDDVRDRWAAILRAEGGREVEDGDDALSAAWVERPGVQYEARESFRALVTCVLQGLERLDVPAMTRTYLSTLWQYLRLYSVEGGGDPAAGAAAAQPADSQVRRRRRSGRPSDRTLADLLHIPRDQLPQLFATLGRLVQGCRSSDGARVRELTA